MANNLNLTPELLDAYIGLAIEKICPLDFGKSGDAHNHCAHFVGHALTLNHDANVGLTCSSMTNAGRKSADQGACIRVHEVFNRTTDLAEPDEKGCLIYTTMASAVSYASGVSVMENIPKKHIGIYLGGTVWHYGNTKDAVKSQTLEEFKKHYSGATVVVYTKFPHRSAFVAAPK